MKKFEDIKRLRKNEKMMLELTGGDNYNTYYCEEHGFQQHRKDKDTEKCGYTSCTSNCRLITQNEIEEILNR